MLLIFEVLLFSIALLGTLWASWHDVRTTEIPDYVPLSMFLSGLFIYVVSAFAEKTFSYISSALILGVSFLIFGYIMYFLGQWGEADTLLGGVIGFLVPYSFSFFKMPGYPLFLYGVSLILTLFLVGGLYSIIFTIIYASRVKGFFKGFLSRLYSSLKYLILILVILDALYFGYLRYNLGTTPYEALTFNFLILFAFVLSVFAIHADKVAFRKKIKVSRLNEGDVLSSNLKELGYSGKRFVGLTKEDIKKLKKHFKGKDKEVEIKEGVRYAPSFFFALLTIWLVGDVFVLLLNLF